MNKNVVIILLLIVSLGSIGYIVYDEVVKEENAALKECNKAKLCAECCCNDDIKDSSIDEEETYRVEHSGVYTKEGKVYKLDVYKEFNGNFKIEDIKINNKTFKLEINDQVLYVNSKKIDEYSTELYITNYYILTATPGQRGKYFTSLIDYNGNIIYLDKNKTMGNFQADNVYLKENGNLVAIGGECCDIEANYDEEIVEFSFINDKLELTKNKNN